MRKRLVFILLLVASSHSILAAAIQVTTRINITILDRSGAVIPQAKLILRNASVRMLAYSKENGAVESELPSGEYQIEVEASGFKKLVITHFEVTAQAGSNQIVVHLESGKADICPVAQGGRIEKDSAPPPETIKSRLLR